MTRLSMAIVDAALYQSWRALRRAALSFCSFRVAMPAFFLYLETVDALMMAASTKGFPVVSCLVRSEHWTKSSRRLLAGNPCGVFPFVTVMLLATFSLNSSRRAGLMDSGLPLFLPENTSVAVGRLALRPRWPP